MDPDDLEEEIKSNFPTFQNIGLFLVFLERKSYSSEEQMKKEFIEWKSTVSTKLLLVKSQSGCSSCQCNIMWFI